MILAKDEHGNISLNPSYTGKWSRGNKKNFEHGTVNFVLTLLILENGLGVTRKKLKEKGIDLS